MFKQNYIKFLRHSRCLLHTSRKKMYWYVRELILQSRVL